MARGSWVRWTLVVALVLPGAVGAQDREPPNLASDRPGLGDGTHVLAPGVWQAELGVTIQAETFDEFLVGNSLLRVGFRDLEFRVTLPALFVKQGQDFLQLSDLGAGLKVPLWLGGGWDWAALGTFTVPVGAEGVSAEDPTLTGVLAGSRRLFEGVDFTFNAGYGFPFGDFGGGTLSLLATPTFAVPGREDLSFYLGYAMLLQEVVDHHYIEWGIARREGPDRQWDVNAGYDPAENVWFLGVGVAQRSR